MQLKRAFISYLPFMVWAVFITVMCTIRMPQSVDTSRFFEGFDKLTHLGFFFVLTVLLQYGAIRYRQKLNMGFGAIVRIVLFAAAIGGGIELLQKWGFPYRSADWWDFFCDTLGVLMAVFSYLIVLAALPRSRPGLHSQAGAIT